MSNPFWQMYFDAVRDRWVLSGLDGAIVYGLACPFNTGSGINVFNQVLINTTGVTPPAQITVRRYSDCTDYSPICCPPDTAPQYLCLNIAGNTGQPFTTSVATPPTGIAWFQAASVPLGGKKVLLTKQPGGGLLQYLGTQTITINTATFQGVITISWNVLCFSSFTCPPFYSVQNGSVFTGVVSTVRQSTVVDNTCFRIQQTADNIGGYVFPEAYDFTCDPLAITLNQALFFWHATGTGIGWGNIATVGHSDPSLLYTLEITQGSTDAETLAECIDSLDCDCGIAPVGIYAIGNIAFCLQNQHGDSVSQPVSTTGFCTGPLAWSATGLPDGLIINAATGQITGVVTAVPTMGGEFTYGVVVYLTDANGCTASFYFSWRIIGPPVTISTLCCPSHPLLTTLHMTTTGSGGCSAFTESKNMIWTGDTAQGWTCELIHSGIGVIFNLICGPGPAWQMEIRCSSLVGFFAVTLTSCSPLLISGSVTLGTGPGCCSGSISFTITE